MNRIQGVFGVVSIALFSLFTNGCALNGLMESEGDPWLDETEDTDADGEGIIEDAPANEDEQLNDDGGLGCQTPDDCSQVYDERGEKKP